jgi:CRISPR-associated protein Cas5 subtype I-B
MKAIIVEITFYEAFFKVHYTKGFRLTYPMPLPTSVAGIFGAMLGIDRSRIKDEFKNFYFGAELIEQKGIVVENETFMQYKTMKVEKGTVRTQIINNPAYLIAIAGKNDRIEPYYDFLRTGNLVYLPYGGQNDFFVEDIEVKDLAEVSQSKIISNYAPQDMVKKFESKKIVFSILPVMHTYSNNPNFYFVLKGQLKLKEPIKIVENTNIAVYPLEMFKFVQG